MRAAACTVFVLGSGYYSIAATRNFWPRLGISGRDSEFLAAPYPSRSVAPESLGARGEDHAAACGPSRPRLNQVCSNVLLNQVFSTVLWQDLGIRRRPI